ncbi:AraC family transcriptional regulator [Leptospira interrogans serovar Weerasinghe]|nr:AraC family transcriptional regulator [Leptospira interrogans serovar Weerasinghe]
MVNIALECGFNSASSFHRACVKFIGKSPENLNLLFNQMKVQVFRFFRISRNIYLFSFFS